MRIRSVLNHGAASTALALALISAPAMAQDAPDEDIVEEEEEETLITVTGSRIKRPEIEGAAPLVASITAETIRQRSFNNIAEALNEIPGFGVAVSSNGGQAGFSVGQNFVNLFGIGSQRTLALVNGRRFVSSNTASNFGGAASGLQVDLNVIPVSLLERVDVLTVRGATTYGSDAISGTVNLVLKDDFEGIEIDSQYGLFEEGDGATYRTAVTLGGNFDEGRGNLTANIEYTDGDGILNSGRALTTNPPFIAGDDLILNRRISALTRGGIPTNGFGFGGLPALGGTFTNADGDAVQFAPNGSLVPFDVGETFGAVNASGGDGLNLAADTGQITSQLERLTFFTLGHYELTDEIRLFFEASYAETSSTELANQPAFQSALFGQLPGNPSVSGPLGVLTSNPFLSNQARNILLSPGNLADADGNPILNFDTDGDGVNDDTQFSLQRASLDLLGGNNANSGQLDVFRIVGGFDGDLDFGGRDFSYSVSYIYGRSQSISTSASIVQANFINAVDAVTDDAGNIVCRVTRDGPDAFSTSTNVAGAPVAPPSQTACVPLNLFGDGAASAEAIDFVTTTTTAEAVNTQRIFNANFGGSPFDIFGNPVGINVGYENRVERSRFTPDGFQQEGLGRAVPISAVEGRFETNELFGEVVIPLIQPDNGSFFHLLEFDASIRYIDNSLAGTDEAWTVGGRFSPIPDITFRASYTESVRAPAITELFLPPVSVFSFADDPCDMDTVDDGPDPATRAANCASIGIDTTTFASNIEDASQQITSSGNPNLLNETSQSWTAGVVVQPSFIPNLSIQADWIDISLTNAIVTLNLTDILASCFDSPAFPNVPTCSQFQRGADNQIIGAQTGDSNAGSFNFAGLQATIRYNFDLSTLFKSDSDLGTIDIAGRYFYQDENNQTIVDTFTDFNGEVGQFQHEANATVTYRNGGTIFSATGVYFSSSVFDNDEGQVDPFDVLSDFFVVNSTLRQEINESFSVRFTVDNLFNRRTPFPSASTNTFFTGTVGRRFTVGLTGRF